MEDLADLADALCLRRYDLLARECNRLLDLDVPALESSGHGVTDSSSACRRLICAMSPAR